MAARVLIQDHGFELLDDSAPIRARRPLDANALKQLNGLAARYAPLEQRPGPGVVHAIGRDLYRWIDGDERALGRLIAQAECPWRVLSQTGCWIWWRGAEQPARSDQGMRGVNHRAQRCTELA